MLNEFKDKIVLVGVMAPASGDNHPSPFDSALYGVLTIANVISNILGVSLALG